MPIEQTIPSPQNGASSPPRSSSESFVEAALAALSDVPDNDNGAEPSEQPRPKRSAPDREEQDGEVEESVPSETDPDDPEGEAEGAEEPDEAHDARGSKEDPFTVKDLPKDKFIELKVDGEKLTVPLDELAAGYIREQTFSARINKTKQMADEAHAALTKARETREQTRAAFREFVQDPEQLYEFFLASDEREKVLEEVAIRYAAQRKRFRENPTEQLAFQRQRDVQRLQAEREHFESQKRAEQEEAQRKEMQQRAERVFRPGWEAGLRKAGFPEATRALYEEVMIRCNQRAQSGQPVTSDDVTDFVVRAAKLLELPPAASKGKPKPPPPSSKPRPATPRRDAWADVPASKRKNDPDYFLRGLRSRDFR